MTPKRRPQNAPGDLARDMIRQDRPTGLDDPDLMRTIAADRHCTQRVAAAITAADPGLKIDHEHVEEQLLDIAVEMERQQSTEDEKPTPSEGSG